MMEPLDELVERASKSEISSVRTVLAKIIEAINNPNTSAMGLKNLIEVDPPLAGRVLKLANSASYGVNRPLVQILDAIITIGFEAVRELALSQKVCEIFSKGDKFYGYTRTALWMHSVGVALCGKMIYRKEFRRQGDDIYTAGLLHDIGIIVEDQFRHTEFVKVLAQMQDEKIPIDELESQHFGFTHMDIGRKLTEAWKLPGELSQIIGIEGRPHLATAENSTMALTLYVANHACNMRRIGFNETPRMNEALYHDCMTHLKLSELAMHLIMDDVEKSINQMSQEGWF
jgi:HD-like signal output (HDOD) protein